MTKTTLTTSTLLSGFAAAALLLPGCRTFNTGEPGRSGTGALLDNRPWDASAADVQPVPPSAADIVTPVGIPVPPAAQITPPPAAPDRKSIDVIPANLKKPPELNGIKMVPDRPRYGDGKPGAKTGTQKAPSASVSTPADASGSYVVKSGDTAGEIANAHGLTTAEFAKLNGLKDPNKIRVGQKLKVPVGKAPLKGGAAAAQPAAKQAPQDGYKYHTVVRGDSLSVIAQKYNLKTARLAEMNNLQTTSIIRVGQHLRVSETKAAGVPPAAVAPSVSNTPAPVQPPATNRSAPAQVVPAEGDLPTLFPLTSGPAAMLDNTVKVADQAIVAGTEKTLTAVKDAASAAKTAVPAPGTYVTTSPDENVFTIAAKSGVGIIELIAANKGLSTEPLPVGTAVKLPAAK